MLKISLPYHKIECMEVSKMFGIYPVPDYDEDLEEIKLVR